MRSWDLLTSVCKETLHIQISSTQVHKNSSALLLPPPHSSPASELLVPASFLISSLFFIPGLPPPCPSPSFVLLRFPSHLSSLPFYISFPPSALPYLPDWGMDGQTGHGPSPPLANWNYNGLTLSQEISKSSGSLGVCVNGVGMVRRPQVWWSCCGLWIHMTKNKSQLCLLVL